MSARILEASSAAATGALIGTAAFARWTLVAASESAASQAAPAVLSNHQAAAAAALGAVATGTFLFLLHAWRPTREALITAALASAGGLAAYTALGTVFAAARAVWHSPWIAPAVAGILLATVAYLAKRRALVPAALVAALALVPWFHSLARMAGDTVAVAATQYAPSPPASHYVGLVLSLAYLGSLIGLLAGRLLRAPAWQGPALGSLAGLAAAIPIICAQVAAFFAATRSGQDPLYVWAAMAFVWTLICLSSALAARAWASGGSPLLRWAPLAVLAAVAAHSMVSGFGSSAYFALRNYHGDSSFVYVHFSAGGTWCRTFDEDGSAAKVSGCQLFLSRYPRSAYRPAALVLLAESQFELWDFESADHTLRGLAKDYPDLRGYPDILGSVSHYAAGRPHELLRAVPDGAFLARWRATQGAVLAGSAAERLGRARRALGFYNSYVEFLHAQPGSSWSAGSISYAAGKADYLLGRLDESEATVPRGTVLLRLQAGSHPLAGVRIALVQPHRDAAFPTDSKQFTGAWSIPAWSGLCGVSDRHGVVLLTNVPYGSYDVVVGLSVRTARRGCVIAPAVSPVAVAQDMTRLPPIRLVTPIKQLSPEPGAQVSGQAGLRWESYPGAAYYAVSIVVVDEPAVGRARRVGKTCWARSRIPTANTAVDARHFVNGHSSLRKGGYYMWIVYAYGPDGRLLSSSEHYNQLHEPAFTLR
jgi:hypothetical protein